MTRVNSIRLAVGVGSAALLLTAACTPTQESGRSYTKALAAAPAVPGVAKPGLPVGTT